MKLSPSFSLLSCLSLCATVFGLSLHGGSDFLLFSHAVAASDDSLAQMNTAIVPETTSILSRRAPKLNRLTTITIVVGVIGGVAMVGALFLGILLVIRKQRDRRRSQDLDLSATKTQDMVRFPSNTNTAPIFDTSAQTKERPYYVYQHLPPRSPPQPEPRRLDDMQSGWFLDRAEPVPNVPQMARTPPTLHTVSSKTSHQKLDTEQNPIMTEETSITRPPRQPISSKTSRQKLGAEQNPIMTEEPSITRPPRQPSRKTSRQRLDAEHPIATDETFITRAPTQTASRARRSESSTRELPPPAPQPTHEPERPPSPLVFRQPEGLSATAVIPRARGSSLPRGTRPIAILPVRAAPAAGRHGTSVSEDIRPSSRFSVSPVARSFPSRLALPGSSPPSTSSNRSSRSRHTRLHGIGSLSSLVHLRTEAAPDVPTDAIAP
ncbi:hypothetical protein C8R43DRAFT_986917 [Mycena crocata]|nr:hypothetical protein C8R43DRAFT_986917 [Mycena crocata]